MIHEYDKNCPFCKAGLLRKRLIYLKDEKTGETLQISVSEETYQKFLNEDRNDNQR
jgi:hypothetical protein